MRRRFNVSLILFVSTVCVPVLPTDSVASCAAPMNCPCDPAGQSSYIFRGMVQSIDETTVALTVLEIFRAASDDPLALAEGDIIGGQLEFTLPCDGLPPSFFAAQELLALYRHGADALYPDCPKYKSCIKDECGTADDDETARCREQCESTTRKTCAEQAVWIPATGRIAAVAWADEMPLRETADESGILRSEDVLILADPEACTEHFPNPPSPPCNDQGGPFSACNTTTPTAVPRTSLFAMLDLLF